MPRLQASPQAQLGMPPIIRLELLPEGSIEALHGTCAADLLFLQVVVDIASIPHSSPISASAFIRGLELHQGVSKVAARRDLDKQTHRRPHPQEVLTEPHLLRLLAVPFLFDFLLLFREL